MSSVGLPKGSNGDFNRLPAGSEPGQREVEMMQISEEMRQMTANDLAMLGMQDIAYVKPALIDGTAGYAIHAADGTQMAFLNNRDLAFAVVRQNELEPVSVH